MTLTAFSQKAREEIRGSALGLSARSYYKKSTAQSWNVIWEAGPYYERVATALEQAHSYAIFVGWQIDSRLELTTSRHETFKEMLVRLCSQKPDLHVYFLMWDHAYFYALERERMQEWIWENVHARVHFVFDNRHPYGGSHHEKCVIIDGELAFLGGIDICDDRWDTPYHFFHDPRRSLRHEHEEHQPYHDISVEVAGEVAADIVEYVGERWKSLTTIPFPERPRVAMGEGRGKYRVLISRTRALVELKRPLLVRETEFLYREAIRLAKSQIVIENQYYWSRQIHEELLELLRRRSGTGFRLFMVLPAGYGGSTAFRMMGTIQSRMIGELQVVARETGTSLTVGCPFSKLGRVGVAKPIYVHSKALISDDQFMIVGSANFNNRGFRLDTELTLTLLGDSHETKETIRQLTRQIVVHWGDEAFERFFARPALVAMTAAKGVMPNIELRSFDSSWAEYLGSTGAWFARHLPVRRMFDPLGPIGYGIKRRLLIGNSARIRRAIPLFLAGALSCTLGATLLAVSLVGQFIPGWRSVLASPTALAALLVYAAIFSSSWLLPSLPLVGAICMGLQLGAGPAVLLTTIGLGVAGGAGYWFARAFPTVAHRLYATPLDAYVTQKLGLRRFSLAFELALDSRVAFRIKAAYFGIFTIPMRWFMVSMALLILTYAILSYAAGLLPYMRDNMAVLAIYVLSIAANALGRARSGEQQRHYKNV